MSIPQPSKEPHPAEIILQQLGGRRFIMMTGARDLGRGDDPHPHLNIRLRSNMTHARGTHVRITLKPSDTYHIEFFKMRMSGPRLGQITSIDQRSDVFAEDLQRVFTELTGLETHL